MKKIIILLLSLCSLSGMAQEKYEAFQYEDKFGVVEMNTLNEFIEPTYSERNSYFDPIALMKGIEYTFIDRVSGKAETYITTNQELRFNGNYYKHFYKDDKSVFIPRDAKIKISFNKKYHEAIGNGSDLIVKHDGLFEVFAKSNFKTPKVKDIKAKKVYQDFVFRKRTQKEEYLTIFYGNAAIYVYDKNYKLLKEYPSDTEYDSKMFEAISGEFTKVEKEDYPPAMALMPEYFSVDNKDGYTIFTSNEFQKPFQIKGNYRNHVIYDEKEWIILINKETNKRYSFRIDFEKKRFLLPKEYQEILEVKFIE
ncbi:hypothetical protein [Paenimyroides baculatum]|uniref:WG containing repeat-containing protein n=1 Tax=Paenimyroides baculatum TaxID=2608000 RepID=A0A5M6CRW4_9FLAO|nr:hypothetical protein [Paenimyroides baculatum]KAA5538058.1 hypothetical protein F0460_00165 [Paenimyroides baculatum]